MNKKVMVTSSLLGECGMPKSTRAYKGARKYKTEDIHPAVPGNLLENCRHKKGYDGCYCSDYKKCVCEIKSIIWRVLRWVCEQNTELISILIWRIEECMEFQRAG